MTVAALEATLGLYRDGLSARIPARALLLQSPSALRLRAEHLERELLQHGLSADVIPVEGQAGGGTLPLSKFPSSACALKGEPEALLARLREGNPPVVGRIEDGRLVLDVRCISDDDVGPLASAVAWAASGAP
jgi:L-seryl-tRNA(Ser) seleniumtransferase